MDGNKVPEMSAQQVADKLEKTYEEMARLLTLAEKMTCTAAAQRVPGMDEKNAYITEARGYMLLSKASATRAGTTGGDTIVAFGGSK